MAKRTSTDLALRKVLSACDQTLKKHSSLYDWMLEHHAALKEAFDRNGPQWPVRVKAMAEAGLTDRTGKPASLRVARNTWYSVCRAVEAKQPKEAKTSPMLTPTPAAKPVQPAPDDTDEPPQGFEFKFAGGPKDWTNKPKTK